MERATLAEQHESEAARLKQHHGDALAALQKRLSDVTAQQDGLAERQREAANTHASAVRDLRNQAQSRQEFHVNQVQELRRVLQNEETVAAANAASVDASRGTLLALQAQVGSLSLANMGSFSPQARRGNYPAWFRPSEGGPVVLGTELYLE